MAAAPPAAAGGCVGAAPGGNDGPHPPCAPRPAAGPGPVADAHCHAAALRHAGPGGVYMINAIDLDDLPEVEAALRSYAGARAGGGAGAFPGTTLRFGFGIHPMSVWKYGDVAGASRAVGDAVRRWARSGLVFVGEVGLDYRPAVLSKWPSPEQGVAAQLAALEAQARAAFALCLPLELHVVNRRPGCWGSVCEILGRALEAYGAERGAGGGAGGEAGKEVGNAETGGSAPLPPPLPPPVVVLHSFSGSWGVYDQVRRALDAAWRSARGRGGREAGRAAGVPGPRLYLSVSHLTEGNHQAEKAVARLWRERPDLVLLETDHTEPGEDYAGAWARGSEVLARCAGAAVSVVQEAARANLTELIGLALPGRGGGPEPEAPGPARGPDPRSTDPRSAGAHGIEAHGPAAREQGTP